MRTMVLNNLFIYFFLGLEMGGRVGYLAISSMARLVCLSVPECCMQCFRYARALQNSSGSRLDPHRGLVSFDGRENHHLCQTMVCHSSCENLWEMNTPLNSSRQRQPDSLNSHLKELDAPHSSPPNRYSLSTHLFTPSG